MSGTRSRLLGVNALAAILVFAVACSEKKPEPAAAPAAAEGLKSAMGQGGPLPPPPSDDKAPAAGGSGSDSFTSPECKALEEEQTVIRKEAEKINAEVVAPAAEKAEAAYDDYQSCQDDAGCLSDLARFQAKQSALASSRRAQEQAEQQVEGLETKLHDISQKMAAKCNTDPL